MRKSSNGERRLCLWLVAVSRVEIAGQPEGLVVSDHLNYLQAVTKSLDKEGLPKTPSVNKEKEEGIEIKGKKWHNTDRIVEQY